MEKEDLFSTQESNLRRSPLQASQNNIQCVSSWAMNNKDNKKKKINRVCMLNPQGYVQYPPLLGKTDTGGQTLYVLELAKALAKRNIKVDILTPPF